MSHGDCELKISNLLSIKELKVKYLKEIEKNNKSVK